MFLLHGPENLSSRSVIWENEDLREKDPDFKD